MTQADPALARTIRRNTLTLSACMALSWAVVQLLATVSAPTMTSLTGRSSLAGLAWATYVAWWALATLWAGRYMDAHGRAAGIRVGFALAAVGCVLVYAGVRSESLISFLAGISAAGAGSGAVNLARAAAADMYPAERRARGISYTLAGAAVGAILGPAVFTPLLARSTGGLDVLGPPCLLGAALMLLGVAITFVIRVDPLHIAKANAPHTASTPPSRPIRAILDAPVVRRALVAAVVAQLVMTSMMSIVSLVMRTHGHHWPAISIAMSAHFLGMFGLVLVVGRVVDRVGRITAAAAGLGVLAMGILMLLADVEVAYVAPAMWAIGVGWNVAFVAATAMMADATQPHERAGLLGFSDFLALGSAALGSVLAGMILATLGLAWLVGIGAALSLAGMLAIVTHRAYAPVAVAEPRCP